MEEIGGFIHPLENMKLFSPFLGTSIHCGSKGAFILPRVENGSPHLQPIFLRGLAGKRREERDGKGTEGNGRRKDPKSQGSR